MFQDPAAGRWPVSSSTSARSGIATMNPLYLATPKRPVAVAMAALVGAWTLASAERLHAQNAPAVQEQDAQPDPWEPLRLLEGTWDAAIEGRLGQGVGRRSYEFIMDGLYLVSRHASIRLPQEKSPAGDHHRELAVYSYDRERGKIILREFIVEGYVIRSVCETEPKRFVCTAEEIESGSGIQSRLTIEISDPYRFEETFELAWPGDQLQVYFTNTWTRIPDLRTLK